MQQIKDGGSYDLDIGSHAAALLKSLDLEVCICLPVLEKLLELCNTISKYPQASDIDISLALLQIEVLIAELESFRSVEEFERFWSKPERLAQTIEVEFAESRRKKVSRRIDDSWQTEVELSAKDRYMVEFFYATIDVIVISLCSRFNYDVLPLL